MDCLGASCFAYKYFIIFPAGTGLNKIHFEIGDYVQIVDYVESTKKVWKIIEQFI